MQIKMKMESPTGQMCEAESMPKSDSVRVYQSIIQTSSESAVLSTPSRNTGETATPRTEEHSEQLQPELPVKPENAVDASSSSEDMVEREEQLSSTFPTETTGQQQI